MCETVFLHLSGQLFFGLVVFSGWYPLLILISNKANTCFLLLLLAALIDEHSVKPIIAMNLPFNAENLQKGFEQLKSRRTVGKIVFSMEEEGEG